METKYDGYYQRDITYKMTLEELKKWASEHNGHVGEEQVLAYMRFKGADFRCKAYAVPAKEIMPTPFGFALTGERVKGILCSLVLPDNNLFNPLMEDHDIFHKQHWFNPHKIEYTPVEYQGCIEQMYFADFCSHVSDGSIELL